MCEVCTLIAHGACEIAGCVVPSAALARPVVQRSQRAHSITDTCTRNSDANTQPRQAWHREDGRGTASDEKAREVVCIRERRRG